MIRVEKYAKLGDEMEIGPISIIPNSIASHYYEKYSCFWRIEVLENVVDPN